MSFFSLTKIKARLNRKDPRDAFIDSHFESLEKWQKNTKRQMVITEEIYQKVHRLEALTKQMHEKIFETETSSLSPLFQANLSLEELSRFIDFYSQPPFEDDSQFLEMRKKVLSLIGLKEVAQIGKAYHPHHTQVLESVIMSNDEFASGDIVEIIQQGFFDERVKKLIRPAKVIVAKTENL
jgi:molecular chaperone GrpE (heat shock protein)